MNRQHPGGSVRPPSSKGPAPSERPAFSGSFGSLLPPPDDGRGERAILADDFARPALYLIAGVFAASLLAFFASSPQFDAPGIWSNAFRFDTALVVLWGPLLGYTLAKAKLWRVLRIYLVLSIFIEPFSEVMLRGQGEGYWDSVLWPAAVAYYGSIKEWSGVPGASLPVFFVVTLAVLYRATWLKRSPDFVAPPKFARNLLLAFFGTVLALTAWGLAHGGGLEGAFQQTLHMMQLPLVALVFLYALRVPEDLAAVGTIFVITALCRAALVAWVYFGVCMPQGLTDQPGLPEWCTTHSDSVLFVVSILIVITYAFEKRTRRAILRAAIVSTVLLVAIVLNNRRLAFVSLLTAPAVIYLALRPTKRKQRITALLAFAVPVLVLYVLIGSEVGGSNPIFKPARLVMSVLDQSDNSSLSRDIENENLIYTLSQSPLVSTGFGFDYQYSPNNPPVDLSDVFINYRLIAHNGVLWLWSLGGVVGFTLLWMIFPVTGTLALRAYRGSETSLERSAALTALGSVAICIMQVWGDQGINGYMVPVTIGVAFAVATRLAVRAT